MATTKAKSRSFVIFRTGGIGDVILASYCLELIEERCPGSAVVWVGRSPGLDFLRDSFPKINVIALPKGESLLRNAGHLFAGIEHADCIVDLQRNGRSLLLSLVLSLVFRARIFVLPKSSTYRSFLVLQARVRGRRWRIKPEATEPRVQSAMLSVCERAIRSQQIPVEAYRQQQPRRSYAARNIKPITFDLAVGVGAKHAPKAVPVSLLASIIDALQRLLAKSLRVVLLGDEADVPKGMDLEAALDKNIKLLNQIGRTNLSLTKALLSESSVCLAADSAVGHLSETVLCPVAVIFGPTSPAFGYQPLLQESQVFSSTIGCRPCSKEGDVKCRYNDYSCFFEIDPEEVARFLFVRIRS